MQIRLVLYTQYYIWFYTDNKIRYDSKWGLSYLTICSRNKCRLQKNVTSKQPKIKRIQNYQKTKKINKISNTKFSHVQSILLLKRLNLEYFEILFRHSWEVEGICKHSHLGKYQEEYCKQNRIALNSTYSERNSISLHAVAHREIFSKSY